LLWIKDKINKNLEFLGLINWHYSCYEFANNGSLHIQNLLWLANALDPNELIFLKKLTNGKIHGWHNHLKYKRLNLEWFYSKHGK
jgi:hypothetical protein